MAINLSNESLDVKISCNQLSSDNYSVNNLLSIDPNLRRNGFRAEYFIRPPIEITFNSIGFAFDIMCLEIGLKSNEHKTNGLEIYFSKSDENKDFELIAKHFSDSNVIKVTNHCYRPNGKLTNALTQRFTKDAEEVMFKSRLLKHCFQIKQIKLKIIKTTNSSVPVIRYSFESIIKL
jgi:hypothetical protein